MNDVEQAIADNFYGGRQANYRYFEDDMGREYCWTTEKVHDDHGRERYQCCVLVPYRPKGKRPTRLTRKQQIAEMRKGGGFLMKPTDESFHELRKDAKARALRLYQEATQS